MKREWWQRGVIYEVYVRSFQDSNADGVGDLEGVRGRLDYLRWLGVDAVWVTPFYPSPMADFGYDILDFKGIDPLFGDLEAFDRLLEDARRRELRVIVDVVPNHSSSEHPWFLESRSARGNAKRDWYVWADPGPDGGPPNNWLSVFGGPAWTFDERSGQFYLHTFLPEQPDLNWRNPAVVGAMFDVMRFWLDRGVDGFRIDSAHHLMKDPQLRDNPLLPPETPVDGRRTEYGGQLHVNDVGHRDAHEIYRRLRRLLDSYAAAGGPPRVALGETRIYEWRQWASYYGAQLDELHLPLNFGLVSAPWDAKTVRTLIDQVEKALPWGAWPSWVLSSHDEQRVASRLGPAQARVGMMLLLTLRGTPMIYYGDELGARDVAVPQHLVQDPWEKNLPGLGLGRDPVRAPMRWDEKTNGSFCHGHVTPWLPVNVTVPSVEAQRDDSCSVLTLTRRLLHERRRNPALSEGRYEPIDQASNDCVVFAREIEAQRLLVALNFTETAQTVHAGVAGPGSVVVSTFLDREEPVELSKISLRPNEGCLIRVLE